MTEPAEIEALQRRGPRPVRATSAPGGNLFRGCDAQSTGRRGTDRIHAPAWERGTYYLWRACRAPHEGDLGSLSRGTVSGGGAKSTSAFAQIDQARRCGAARRPGSRSRDATRPKRQLRLTTTHYNHEKIRSCRHWRGSSRNWLRLAEGRVLGARRRGRKSRRPGAHHHAPREPDGLLEGAAARRMSRTRSSTRGSTIISSPKPRSTTTRSRTPSRSTKRCGPSSPT